MPYSLASSVIAPFAGGFAGKHGSRDLTRIGPCIYIIALLIFITFNTDTKMWEIVFASILMGIGNGLFQSPSNTAIITSVKKEELGIASGILSLSRNLGNILGVAITITIFESFKNIYKNFGEIPSFVAAYHNTMFVGILFGIVCLGCSYVAYSNENPA